MTGAGVISVSPLFFYLTRKRGARRRSHALPPESLRVGSPAPVIRLHPDDGVLIARSSLPPGMVVADGVTTVERIPAGHKVAIRRSRRRADPPLWPDHRLCDRADRPGPARAYSKLRHGRFRQGLRVRRRRHPDAEFRSAATFDGIRRPDGRVATRNYIGILTSVNCSAHVAGMVADVFKKNPFTGDNPLADFPNVDGVVALTHKTGCGMTQDEPLTVLRRRSAATLACDFSAVVVLGLAARSIRSAG